MAGVLCWGFILITELLLPSLGSKVAASFCRACGYFPGIISIFFPFEQHMAFLPFTSGSQRRGVVTSCEGRSQKVGIGHAILE